MTKQEILLAAAQVFGEKGYHAASMQDIADAVRLQKPSLYHHVKGKQELLAGILDQALDMLIERMQAVVTQDAPAGEKIRGALVAYQQAMAEFPDLAAVLLLEHRSLDPARRKDHVRKRDQFEAMWADLIKAGVQDGEFACEDPRLAAKALLGVANWTVTWFRPSGRLSAGEIARVNADLLLNGLRTR